MKLALFLASFLFIGVQGNQGEVNDADVKRLLLQRASTSRQPRRRLGVSTSGKGKPVNIDSKFITINRVKYSRYGASSGDLGSFGEVLEGKDKSRTNWQGSAPEAWVQNNIKLGTKITLSKDDVQKFSLRPGATAQIAVEGVPVAEIRGGVSINLKTKTSTNYALQEVLFDSEVKVTKWLTQHGVLCDGSAASWTGTELEDACFTFDYLKHLGGDLRIVTTAWVLMPDTEELASSEDWKQCIDIPFTLEVSDAAHVIKGGVEDGDFSRCTKLSVSFSPETVMATEASRVEWRMDPKNTEKRATPLRALRLSKDSY